ncbi:MAG TPA: AI-2E family transporter [Rubricoccaceae bacterium]|nr:AI-2E family transporter [Rubricoccaceae bacterium]
MASPLDASAASAATPRPDAARPFAVGRALLFQGILALGGLIAFLLLLLEFEAGLNPLIVAAAGAIVLWPLRKQKAIRGLLLAGGFLLGLWLLRTLGGVLAPFAVVFLLAYMLNPLVGWIGRRLRLPRWAGALLCTLLLVGLLVAVVLLIVPALVGQLQSLAQRLLGLISGLPTWVARTDTLDPLEQAGLIQRDRLVADLTAFVSAQVRENAGRLPAVFGGLTRSVGTLFGLITTLALVPVLLFYTLKDYPTLRGAVIQLFPRYRGSRAYLSKAVTVVGNYLRGQLTISLAQAVIVTIPLVLFRVPFGLVIGILAGLLNFIPNLGAILTYVIGILLTLAFGTVGDLIVVVAVLAGQAILEQTVLTPNIMSHSVGLHPVLVLLSLFVFSALFGFLGLLIAVPVTALLVGVYQAYRDEMTLDLAAAPRLIVTPDEAS